MLKQIMRIYYLLAAMLLTPLALAGVHETVRFDPGTSATTIEGAVARGEVDTYTLRAKPGQIMSVSINSLENNAVFQIYGNVEDSWVGLIGADEGDDATNWRDELPGGGDGRFKIVVDTTRGGAEYTLELSIE